MLASSASDVAKARRRKPARTRFAYESRTVTTEKTQDLGAGMRLGIALFVHSCALVQALTSECGYRMLRLTPSTNVCLGAKAHLDPLRGGRTAQRPFRALFDPEAPGRLSRIDPFVPRLRIDPRGDGFGRRRQHQGCVALLRKAVPSRGLGCSR